jgi:hypothetical protein
LARALGQEIQKHFIECASFHENCEIHDTHGRVTKEIDLALLNRFHPTFLLTDPPRSLYMEGVIAAAEVKTSLDKRDTIDCLEKAQAFKRLLARVEGNDLAAHSVDSEDTFRFLIRRPFFAFAYEDSRPLSSLQKNIEEWMIDNCAPDHEKIDAVFVLNKGIMVNLASGAGAIEAKDAKGNLVSGFARRETKAIFSQLILWLSLVCPSFSSLNPILLKYAAFSTEGYRK